MHWRQQPDRQASSSRTDGLADGLTDGPSLTDSTPDAWPEGVAPESPDSAGTKRRAGLFSPFEYDGRSPVKHPDTDQWIWIFYNI